MRLADILAHEFGKSESLPISLQTDALAVLGGRFPKFVIDNVAEYYFMHPKEKWKLDDFPDARPPFNGMWIEYELPHRCFSTEAGEMSLDIPGWRRYFGATVLVNDSGIVDIRGQYWDVNREGVHPRRSVGFRYRHVEGEAPQYWLPPAQAKEGSDTDKAQALYPFHPVLMALSFANCQNIETVTVKAPPKLQKARERRGKRPFVAYSVVNIVPIAKHRGVRAVRDVESETGEGVALHIRRGHFAKYGPKYDRQKLFGKYEGRFWIPATAVGAADVGIHDHSYEVKAK